MRRALLVAHEHMMELLAVIKRVVDIDGLTTRVAKDRLHANVLKRRNKTLRARHLHSIAFAHLRTGPSLPSSIICTLQNITARNNEKSKAEKG